MVAAAKPATFDVVEKLSKPDTASWDYVSQHGTDDEVIAMLERENVRALNLDRVAFRMRDRAFFERATRLLKARHEYHPTLWSYGLFHNAPAVAREFLTHADQLVAEAGGPIDTPLLTVDPVARHPYEHLEYRPLVNARAHALGDRRQVVNPALHDQYHRLLKQLSYRTQLTDDDLLAVTYYLLVQDRVEEALASFAPGEPGPGGDARSSTTTAPRTWPCAGRSRRSPGRSRSGTPGTRWTGGGRRSPRSSPTRTRRPRRGPGRPTPTTAAGGRTGSPPPSRGSRRRWRTGPSSLTWQNLDAVQVNYHLMDVELLFSRSAVRPGVGRAVRVHQADRPQTVKLPAGKSKVAVPLPDELARRNVLVEVTAGGQDPGGAVVRGRDGRAADGGLRPGEGDGPGRRAGRCRRCT